MNARMRVKELCDSHQWDLGYGDCTRSGSDHLPWFSIEVHARAASGETKLNGKGHGATKDVAKEAACAAALGGCEVRPRNLAFGSLAQRGAAGCQPCLGAA